MEQTEPRVPPKQGLPKPELNPMLNPVLGQNLGRWAQVYFTSPPEKREEAVVELLRELEGGKADALPPIKDSETELDAERTSIHPGPSNGSNGSKSATKVLAVAKLFCPECHGENAPEQKFCGICGAPLHRSSAVSDRAESNWLTTQEGRASESPAPPTAESDPDWVRGRIFGSTLLSEPEVQEETSWGKYAIFGLVLILGGFGALQWLSNKPPKVVISSPMSHGVQPSSGVPPQASSVAPQTQTSPQPDVTQSKVGRPMSSQLAELAPNAATENAKSGNTQLSPQASKETVTSKGAQAEQEIAREQPAVVPAKATVQSGAGSPTDAVADNGAQEFRLAQYYLAGKNGPRDSSEASKWLWKALAKQNVSAGLMLADLYMRGDGVAKNCEQARLLLVAASEKGSSEAAAKLRSLETGSCR